VQKNHCIAVLADAIFPFNSLFFIDNAKIQQTINAIHHFLFPDLVKTDDTQVCPWTLPLGRFSTVPRIVVFTMQLIDMKKASN